MKNTICCGNEVTTPFCPTCGKILISKSHNIGTLLAHIRTSIKMHEKTVRYVENLPKRQDELEENRALRRERLMKKRKQTIEKWATWEMELVALIQKASDKEVYNESTL